MQSRMSEAENGILPQLAPIHAALLKKSFERRRIPFLVITVIAIGFTIFATMFLPLGTSVFPSEKFNRAISWCCKFERTQSPLSEPSDPSHSSFHATHDI